MHRGGPTENAEFEWRSSSAECALLEILERQNHSESASFALQRFCGAAREHREALRDRLWANVVRQANSFEASGGCCTGTRVSSLQFNQSLTGLFFDGVDSATFGRTTFWWTPCQLMNNPREFGSRLLSATNGTFWSQKLVL